MSLDTMGTGTYHELTGPLWAKSARDKLGERRMRRASFHSFFGRTQGQSMIETALLLPILLIVAFNAINFGYFFFVALNLAAAPRTGVQWSILGPSTPGGFQWAKAGPASSTASVSYLTYQDITGVLVGASTTKVQVCSRSIGIDNATKKALCCETTNSGGPCTLNGNLADHDPEYDSVTNTTKFIRHQVDVYYDINPIIPSFEFLTPAGPIPITLLPTFTIHRQVTMRNM